MGGVSVKLRTSRSILNEPYIFYSRSFFYFLLSEPNIGVIGYSDSLFNESKAKKLVQNGLEEIINDYSDEPVIISGLTNLGIPRIAYEEAPSQKWKTVGFACSRSEEYDTFDVDKKHIIGDEWGDKSEEFLNNIDVLLRVGGRTQLMEEAEKARRKGIRIYEYEF